MKADEKELKIFLEMKHQLVIPVYQRSYSWTLKQCKELWKDIEYLAYNKDAESHFIGSIVHIKDSMDKNETPQELIIDGQQRITTVLLIICAMVSKIKASNSSRAEELLESFLINRHNKGDLRYKMLLIKEDRESLINIIEERTALPITSLHIKENYEFFLSKIKTEEVEKLYSAIRKLMIIDIMLESHRDNPQRIFESLNSTGLDLSASDLIRNFILMELNTKEQEEVYVKYWLPIERSFGQENYSDFFTKFIRDYLTSKQNSIPKMREIYEVFKKYFIDSGGVSRIDTIMQDMLNNAIYYSRIALDREEKHALKKAFRDLNDLNVDIVYPFLMVVYGDFEEKCITEKDFIRIIECISSYIFRRFVCDLATASLSNTFATLYKEVDINNYVYSTERALALLNSYRRFPTDEEFCNALRTKDMYNIRLLGKVCLERLENYESKESSIINDKTTIEHIMPRALSFEWKVYLGANYADIHMRLLNTIGNLTLTGYNSELSNKSFLDKKEIQGGFNNSKYSLNKNLVSVEVWNEASIVQRTAEMAKTMCKVWKYLSLTKEEIEQYKSEKALRNQGCSIEIHTNIAPNGSMSAIFEELRKRILELDISIREEVLKLYVAYKYKSNIVDIEGHKSKIGLTINLKFDEVDDPLKRCKNVIDKGKWGNGDVRLDISTMDVFISRSQVRGNGDVRLDISTMEEIEYAVNIIEQSYKKQIS